MYSDQDSQKERKKQLSTLTPIDKQKQIAAVIISIQNGFSYDDLFKKVQQKSAQGTQVVVFTCSSFNFKQVEQIFYQQPKHQASKQLKECINKVDPDCVVFNWQCSQCYDLEKFSQYQQNIFKFLKQILSKGYMAMFSDFSLKTLIKNWDEKYLGPNPFIRDGDTNFPFQISFNPNTLKQCPSAQLQIVGQMAQNGQCSVNVMPSTIKYVVNQKNLNHDIYKLQVLTIVSKQIPPQINRAKKKTPPMKFKQQKVLEVQEKIQIPLQFDNFKGNVGHVLLTYKQGGGHLLTSMGHWIQLMKIDTSMEKVFSLAKEQYGQKEFLQMQKQYLSIQQSEKKQWISAQSKKFIQNRAPCRDMNRKKKGQ